MRRLAQTGLALMLAVALLAGSLHVASAGSSPSFGSPSTNPFGLSDVGNKSKPIFTDIDGDGDLDAFVGEMAVATNFFRNTGSAIAPAFALSTSTSPFGLSNASFYSVPRFADLDDDGDLDAFFGEWLGNTIYYRNTGSAVVPAFAGPSTNPFGLSDVGSRSAPAFVDIDGDGDLDAFIGESNGNTIYFPASAPTAVTLTHFSARLQAGQVLVIPEAEPAALPLAPGGLAAALGLALGRRRVQPWRRGFGRK